MSYGRVIPLDKVLLICQSQTEALALKKVLAGAGVTGCIVRPPRHLAAGSCTYAVSIPRGSLPAAQKRMRDMRFIPCKIV